MFVAASFKAGTRNVRPVAVSLGCYIDYFHQHLATGSVVAVV
jgi:hypothetical protein